MSTSLLGRAWSRFHANVRDPYARRYVALLMGGKLLGVALVLGVVSWVLTRERNRVMRLLPAANRPNDGGSVRIDDPIGAVPAPPAWRRSSSRTIARRSGIWG